MADSMKESNSVLPDVLINLGVIKPSCKKWKSAPLLSRKRLVVAAARFNLRDFAPAGYWVFPLDDDEASQAGSRSGVDFTRSKAKIFGAEGHGKERITFKDVAG